MAEQQIPTPEAAELQKLFERNEKEIIKCLIDETKELYDKLEAWEKCDKQYKDILDQILREFPVGNIAEHTIESLPERISYYLKELAEYTQKVEAWEKCAENLVDYAHDFVAHLSTWGKGYDRNDKQIKLAEDAIEEYNRLKNETKPND
jgi:predicted RNase H-like nuclease (RuvC/YqgF family)